MSTKELLLLQEEDTTLDAVWDTALEGWASWRMEFFKKSSLLYQGRMPTRHRMMDLAVEELVLPCQCHGMALKLAYNISLRGHLGKNRTADRILQRFHWPTLPRQSEVLSTLWICQKWHSRGITRYHWFLYQSSPNYLNI